MNRKPLIAAAKITNDMLDQRRQLLREALAVTDATPDEITSAEAAFESLITDIMGKAGKLGPPASIAVALSVASATVALVDITRAAMAEHDEKEPPC